MVTICLSIEVTELKPLHILVESLKKFVYPCSSLFVLCFSLSGIIIGFFFIFLTKPNLFNALMQILVEAS